MKKVLLILSVLLVSSIAYANDVLDELKKNPLYPSEYWIATDYNPAKDRDWQFGEVTNGFKWKFKQKPCALIPDEFLIQWDYNPDKDRDWTCQEITTGCKWNLK